MAISKRIGGTALLSSLLASTAALADVSAEQVWADWRTYLSIDGEDSLTVGSENMTNGTLILNDVTISVRDPETNTVMTIDKITFTENGDGTVTVAMSDSFPIRTTITPEDEETVTVEMTVLQNGMVTTASGTPDAINYDFTADSYGLVIDSITPSDEMTLNEARFVMQGVEGNYVSREGDPRHLDSSMTASTLEIAIDAAEAGGPGTFSFTGMIEGITATANVALPAEMDMENPEEMFAQGFAVEGGYTTGAGEYSFSFADDTQSGEGTARAAGGEITFAMDRTGMTYSGAAQQPWIHVTSSDLPFPVEVSLAEYSYGLTVPLAATDEPVDFGLRLNLADLTLDESVWSLFDPEGRLPHDPMTFALDLSGTGRLFYDAMDPDQAEAMAEADMPGELYSLTLEDLTLRAVGVEAMGSGAFTFDNTDLESFGGFPAPAGSASLRVRGANALIDNLIAMGVVPQDQALGARMMLGLFATPVGEDELESTIEITEDGQIFANGQRLQ